MSLSKQSHSATGSSAGKTGEPNSILAQQSTHDEHLNDASSDSAEEDDGSGDDNPRKRPKRARACENCRSMKIRCVPVDGQEACRNCSKTNKSCVMPGPIKKRQKTAHRVAELEKKINTLTEALMNKNQTVLTPSTDSPSTNRVTESISGMTPADGATENDNRYSRMLFQKAYQNAEQDFSDLKYQSDNRGNYVDVVDAGLIDMPTASDIFHYWRFYMRPYFPAVVLPSRVGPEEVRKSRPMLFLAVLAMASGKTNPVLHRDLVVELNRQLCDRVLFHGEKSIELVQAILIYCAYYTRVRFAKDLSFNQFAHLAVVMCFDLGIGKRFKKDLARNADEAAELSRTWLSCYHVASSVSVLLRQPALIRWTTYMDECLKQLENGSTSYAGDKWTCSVARLQRIMEEIKFMLDLDGESPNISFAEPRVQYQVKMFESQLSNWRQTVPADIDQRVVEHLVSSVNLYLHELALQDPVFEDSGVIAILTEPNTNQTRKPMTSAQIEALTICLDSSYRILDSYLAFDLSLIARTLSNFYLVWNVYAAVALIKLQALVDCPKSNLSTVFPANLRTDFYLDAMLTRLEEVSSGGRWGPAEAFGYIFRKLKFWHLHKKTTSGNDISGSNQLPPMTTTMAQSGLAGTGQTSVPISDTNVPDNTNDIGLGPSDLNAAFNASFDDTPFNVNWNDINFSADELNIFDFHMNDYGWMSHIL